MNSIFNSTRFQCLCLLFIGTLGSFDFELILLSSLLYFVAYVSGSLFKRNLPNSTQFILYIVSIASFLLTLFTSQPSLSLHYSLSIGIAFTFFNYEVSKQLLKTYLLQFLCLIFIHYQNISYVSLILLCLSIPFLTQLCYLLFLYPVKKSPAPWHYQLSFVSSLLALALYLFLPRIQFDEGGVYTDEVGVASGQASHSLMTKQDDDLISLKGIDKLKLLREPLFEFSYQSTSPDIKLSPYLYLKKQSYDIYDQGEWKTNITDPILISDLDDETIDQWVQINPQEPNAKTIEFSITPLMPVTNYFSFGLVLAFQSDELFIRGLDNYFNKDDNQLLPYKFKSQIKQLGINQAPNTGYIAPNEVCYTYPKHLEKQLHSLSLKLKEDQNSFALLKQIERNLKTDYTYSLNSGGNGIDPFLDLIKGHQGWCVHFATAMTLMARYHGFPARVASGVCVLTPEAHPSKSLVRLSHSHAWTEIYIEPFGWTVWDATPESGLPRDTNFSTIEDADPTHPFFEFISRLTQKINTHQPLSKYNLFVLASLSLLFLIFALVSFFKSHKVIDSEDPFRHTRNNIYQPPTLSGIWGELNQFLDSKHQIKEKESIAQHIERIQEDFEQLDFEQLAKYHNACSWGHKSLDKTQEEWVKNELIKLSDIHSDETET